MRVSPPRFSRRPGQLNPAKPELARVLAPTPRKNAIFGFLIGIVLAAIGAYLLQRFDRRLRSLAGMEEVFCLTTQAGNYFVQKGGFRIATPDDLPTPRRELYDASGRRSQVLVKRL